MANARTEQPTSPVRRTAAVKDAGRPTLAGKRKPYRSPAITERRRRILASTMAMISARGIDGFNLADVSREAGVAQKTLYNSFGSRDALIATAFDFFLEEQGRRFPADAIADLDSIFDQLAARCEDFIGNREWVRGSNFLYFSFTTEERIYRTLKDMSLIYGRHVFHLFADSPDLRHDVPIDYIEMQMSNVAHGTVHDWLMGRITDKAFPSAVCLGVVSSLLALVGGRLEQQVRTLIDRFSHQLQSLPVPDQLSVASAAGE